MRHLFNVIHIHLLIFSIISQSRYETVSFQTTNFTSYSHDYKVEENFMRRKTPLRKWCWTQKFSSTFSSIQRVQNCFLLSHADRFISMQKVRIRVQVFCDQFHRLEHRRLAFLASQIKVCSNVQSNPTQTERFKRSQGCFSTTPLRLTKRSAVHCSFASNEKCIFWTLRNFRARLMLLLSSFSFPTPEDFFPFFSMSSHTTTIKQPPRFIPYSLYTTPWIYQRLCFCLCSADFAVVPLFFQGDRWLCSSHSLCL